MRNLLIALLMIAGLSLAATQRRVRGARERPADRECAEPIRQYAGRAGGIAAASATGAAAARGVPAAYIAPARALCRAARRRPGLPLGPRVRLARLLLAPALLLISTASSEWKGRSRDWPFSFAARSGRVRHRARDRGDEVLPRFRHREAARLEHMAREKISGQRKAVAEFARAPAASSASARRKAGSRSNLSLHSSPADARDRAARFRRHIDEIGRTSRSPRSVPDRGRNPVRSTARSQNERPEPRSIPRRRHGRGSPAGNERRFRADRVPAAAASWRRDASPHRPRARMSETTPRAAAGLPPRKCRDARRAARATPRATNCPAAAPAACAIPRRRAPGQDDGRARASSVPRWRSPLRGA